MGDRRVAGPVAAAVTLGLLLAGCVTGSPPSDVVATVSNDPGGGRPPEQSAAARPPSEGLDPVAVARGFMQAMSSQDAAVAQAWVTDGEDARDTVQSWVNSSEVHVYDRFEVLGAMPSSQGAQVEVRISARHEGTLTGDTWHRVAASQEIELTVERADGEWRVADPPASPWVTRGDFANLFERAKLYHVAPDERHLTPRPVFFRKPRRPPPTAEAELPPLWEESAMVQTVLDRLLSGPTDADGALTTAIPPGTTAQVQPGEDVITIDLSPEFAAEDGGPGRIRVGQIVWTATNLIQTRSVELTVGGEPPGRIGSDGFDPRGQWRWSTPPLDRLLAGRGGSADTVLFTRAGRTHSVPVDGGDTELAPAHRTSRPTGSRHAPSWSPQGNRIAFLADEIAAAADGRPDQPAPTRRLYVGPASGGEALATDLAGTLSEPSWTPDGSKLLAFRHDGGRTSLWSVDAGTGATRRLELPGLPAEELTPTTIRVSPDGAVALVLATDGPTQPGRGGDLYTGQLTADGITSWTPLALQPGLRTIRSPIWVEPGVIGFVANSGSLGDRGSLWTVEADGWNPDQVEFGAEHPGELAGDLSASPDGERLVFTVRTDVSSDQIFAIRRHGENILPQPLTGPGTYESDADPSLGSP